MTAKILTKRRTVATFAGGALLALSPLVTQTAVAAEPELTVAAKGAALLDGDSGKTLYGKDADTARPMASTTKIMTAYVVLDKGADLDLQVPVKQEYRDYVTEHSTSTADLQTGDKLTVRQLLYAALLPSGADAGFALADTFGTGDTIAARTESFVSQMNEKAEELGLPKTEFDSFDGTGSDSSTPTELAELARRAMENDTFRTVVATKQYEAEAPAANGRTRYYTWNNTNQLLGSYDGVIGIKTGSTTPAGECLVFAATRGDKTLVGTVLNSTDRYGDAAKLLDYGFGSDIAKNMKLRKLPANSQRD
ncbi:D-alanyl-D-alanine carboxypeptidase family protein [Streptomyces corynorhini]|uniref:D-alanyl-D-alanine carboxypeptidase n=1 Tax=Streptomyces corynorhini TaxID=2282652 RepID=A0A370B715_9ACTN|nr:serine hydrolase [Streptomyces corynorhini]RDG35904.1 D-alanyl-D-alanine carboxypeptidase [Streptomyces corynorhini]